MKVKTLCFVVCVVTLLSWCNIWPVSHAMTLGEQSTSVATDSKTELERNENAKVGESICDAVCGSQLSL